MKCTEENLELMLELQEAFEEKTIEIVKEKYVMEKERKLLFDEIKSIEYGNDEIEVTLIRYRNCSCCSDDEAHYTFPTNWLFSNNWKEDYHLELQKKREKAEKEKEEKEKKLKEEKEKKEKEQYEQLKEKFETKTFLIVFYNRFANQTQSTKIQAETAFRAGRAFYRKYNRKAYHACIQLIEEI